MSNKKIKDFNSRYLKIVSQIIGILVTIVALIFAVKRTLEIGQSNWDKLLNSQVLLVILFGGFAYVLGAFLLVWAWKKLLAWFGQPARFKLCIAVYGRTQLAKFIPGNVFHLPSRHIVGRQVGFSHSAQIGAAIYEIMGLVISAAVITLIGLSNGIQLKNSSAWFLSIVVFFIVISLLIQFFIRYFKVGDKLGFPDRSISDGFMSLVPIWAIYVGFFVLTGTIYWVIVGTATGAWLGIPIQVILAIYAASWVTGFLTPGAPAGIGVREATMILILSNFIGAPTAALVAIISRLVVTIGDILFFALSNFFPLSSLVDN